jgi:putative flippase GtrA
MHAAIAILSRRLRLDLNEAQLRLLIQFLQFATIGAFGFLWDTGTVYALAPRVGPYAAGVAAFVVAASVNWLLNRFWTFRHLDHGAMHRQWAMFLAANSIGFVLNRGTYFALVATSPLCRTYLVLPVAAGAVAGMFANFSLSRRMVFR